MLWIRTPLTPGKGLGSTFFASSFVREVSIGLLGEPEMYCLQLGEDAEDQDLHVGENIQWPVAAA